MGVILRCKKCATAYFVGSGFTGPGEYPDGVKKCENCGADLTIKENTVFAGLWD